METTFLGWIAFAAFQAAYYVQKCLSAGVWLLLIKPQLGLMRCVNDATPEHLNKVPNIIVIDCLKPGKKQIWLSYTKSMRAYSYVQGVQNQFDFFKKLIRWNPQVPLIGFVHDKVTQFIEPLFEENKEGTGRYTNPQWLQTNKFHGNFQIVKKEIEDGKLVVWCAWISGEDTGKVFKIAEYGAGRDKDVRPSTIYFPPKAAVFVCETIFSITAVIAIGSLLYGLGTFINPYLTQFIEVTREAWSSGVRLVQTYLN